MKLIAREPTQEMVDAAIDMLRRYSPDAFRDEAIDILTAAYDAAPEVKDEPVGKLIENLISAAHECGLSEWHDAERGLRAIDRLDEAKANLIAIINSPRIAELEAEVASLQSQLAKAKELHKVAGELCDAMDLAADDIGGHRPIDEILRELGPAVDAFSRAAKDNQPPKRGE